VTALKIAAKSSYRRGDSETNLERVAQELNARPRKTLGWDTPAERIRDLLIPI
jgi:IS30 family transposase